MLILSSPNLNRPNRTFRWLPLRGCLQMLFLFEILVRMELMAQPIPQTPFLELKTMTVCIYCYLQSFPLRDFNKKSKQMQIFLLKPFLPIGCKADGVKNSFFIGYNQSSLFSCSHRSYLKIINPVISYQLSGIINQLQRDGLHKY